MTERLKPKQMNRRDFLGLTSLWTAGAAIGVFFADIMRLPKPQVLPEASNWFRVGSPIEYPSGTLRILAEQKVRIISTPEGIAAMSLICTHLGCIVGETADGFQCPCHGSVFDVQGRVVGGPAPRPLRWLEVSQAVDGTLLVNSSKEVNAGVFYQPFESRNS